MKNKKNYMSQIGQDTWVLDVLREKREGTFIDIGGGHPEAINNTLVLEKEYLWTGISLDIGPPYTHGCEEMTIQKYKDFWSSKRNTPIVVCDALKTNYVKLFEDSSLPTIIDYLSIDLEPPIASYECLKLIPFDKYRFNVITFETDYYREKTTREPSRKLLASYGYVLSRGDVNQQEDWYIHGSCL